MVVVVAVAVAVVVAVVGRLAGLCGRGCGGHPEFQIAKEERDAHSGRRYTR